MNNLQTLINDINKQYKAEIIKVGSGYNEGGKIPFSSPKANYVTRGGIPRGKSTEFSGTESGGKTTTALDIVGNAQHIAEKEFNDRMNSLVDTLTPLEEKNNKSDQQEIKKLKEQISKLTEDGVQKVIYVDLENTLDEDWARLNGVNIDDLILIRPESQTAEQVLQMVLELAKTGNIILIVVDSIPMLVPQQIFEEDMEKKMYAGVSGPLTVFSAKVTPILAKNNVALLGINQNRDNLDSDFGEDNNPGGRAWKHLQAMRIQFRKGSLIDENNQEVPLRTELSFGNLVMMKMLKNKVSKPDRKLGNYTLRYDIGIDVLADTVDLAIKYGMIKQSGSFFKFIDLETGEILTDGEKEINIQGRSKLLAYIREHDNLYSDMYEKVNKMSIE